MKSYSQYGEDLKVAELFSVHGAIRPGLALEIGAWSPREFSNSRLLIEAGWKAVLVEFSPSAVFALVKEYGYSDRVQVIQAAITAGPEHVKQFEVTEDALSSADPEHLKLWRERGGFYGKLWAQTLTVRALLDQFFGDQAIDFVSVDTEGSSNEIAIALMESDHRPPVVLVEYGSNLAYLEQRAQARGYKTVATNGTNVILAR